jgi:hypothetical protein
MGCWEARRELEFGAAVVVSGVGAAVDGEIGTGHVGGLGAGDEGDQGGDFVNGSVAAEGGGGLLRDGPIADGGIQLGVNGAGLARTS